MPRPARPSRTPGPSIEWYGDADGPQNPHFDLSDPPVGQPRSQAVRSNVCFRQRHDLLALEHRRYRDPSFSWSQEHVSWSGAQNAGARYDDDVVRLLVSDVRRDDENRAPL